MFLKALRNNYKIMIQRVAFLFCAFGLALIGCASPPDLYPPEQTPPYVRQIKSFRLYANEVRISTNILLNSGDLVTVTKLCKIVLTFYFHFAMQIA